MSAREMTFHHSSVAVEINLANHLQVVPLVLENQNHGLSRQLACLLVYTVIDGVLHSGARVRDQSGKFSALDQRREDRSRSLGFVGDGHTFQHQTVQLASGHALPYNLGCPEPGDALLHLCPELVVRGHVVFGDPRQPLGTPVMSPRAALASNLRLTRHRGSFCSSRFRNARSSGLNCSVIYSLIHSAECQAPPGEMYPKNLSHLSHSLLLDLCASTSNSSS